MELARIGINALVIHTDGSVENARLLKNGRTIAIMQHDIALAARSGSESVYGKDLKVEIPPVPNIRRIAVLHKATVHVMLRRESNSDGKKKLNENNGMGLDITVLADLQPSDICVGPELSGTRVLAQAILKRIKPGLESGAINLPVTEMVRRLQSGELKAGFFVSHVPSDAVRTILDDTRFQLLSIDSRTLLRFVDLSAYKTAKIDHIYESQKETELAIQTFFTREVLVTTAELNEKFDVKAITEAIFMGTEYLGDEVTQKSMAQNLPSLPLHPDAKAYYEENEYLPAKPKPLWRRNYFQTTWYSVAILVMLAGCYSGLVKIRRNITSNKVAKRILAISVEASVSDSVEKLREIRDEIRDRVRIRWWRAGELDKDRWRYLHDLITHRVNEARENLTRQLAAEIRTLADQTDLDKKMRQQRHNSMEARIWQYFEKGELDAAHQSLLLEVIQKNSHHDAGNARAKPVKRSKRKSKKTTGRKKV